MTFFPAMTSAPMGRVERGCEGYPRAFERLEKAPAALWFKGRLPRPGERTVAIVGSRAASGAGRARARELAGTWARSGIAIVSGGAFGIDAAAHEGALDEGGASFAVLGCGVDVVYPDRHGPLFARLALSGGLLSERLPGAPPRAWHFPARNRLIAALSQAVVVVEAALRSGALITARIAQDERQPVLAVPGSPGTDELLHSGVARALCEASDLEDALAGRPPRPWRAPPPARFDELLGALRERAEPAAALARRLELPLSTVVGALAEAELEGWVRRLAGGRYEVARGG